MRVLPDMCSSKPSSTVMNTCMHNRGKLKVRGPKTQNFKHTMHLNFLCDFYYLRTSNIQYLNGNQESTCKHIIN